MIYARFFNHGGDLLYTWALETNQFHISEGDHVCFPDPDYHGEYRRLDYRVDYLCWSQPASFKVQVDIVVSRNLAGYVLPPPDYRFYT